MVKIAILGKTDLIQKIGWCRRFSDYKPGDDDQKNAQHEIKLNFDAMVAATDPALDSLQILPKLKDFDFTLPNSDQFELLSNVLINDFSLYTLFAKKEVVPGRPDYDFGIGFMLQSNEIFFEEKLYKMVKVVNIEKKLGGLIKKKNISKRRQTVKMADLYGQNFANDLSMLSILKFSTDNRDNKRFSVRLSHNIMMQGKDTYFVNKLPLQWKDEAIFLEELSKECHLMEECIDKTYLAVGYEEAPDFTIFLGEIDPDRKIGELSIDTVNDTAFIDVTYA